MPLNVNDTDPDHGQVVHDRNDVVARSEGESPASKSMDVEQARSGSTSLNSRYQPGTMVGFGFLKNRNDYPAIARINFNAEKASPGSVTSYHNKKVLPLLNWWVGKPYQAMLNLRDIRDPQGAEVKLFTTRESDRWLGPESKQQPPKLAISARTTTNAVPTGREDTKS
ncbi:hypothetical protein BDV96DRAFT_650498 [Lophiotrema nucula]|uniref:Uncharacterized protein n=1 Tax=Lophiotrema nucula TaxID=690887 RepID=A0A6A5YXM9_9PLEO|nr:hypothetical protein BDV96DRAFT_650498 [Lophiotrema nucula]